MNNLTERTQKILNEIITWNEAKSKGVKGKESYEKTQADILFRKLEKMVNEDED